MSFWVNFFKASGVIWHVVVYVSWGDLLKFEGSPAWDPGLACSEAAVLSVMWIRRLRCCGRSTLILHYLICTWRPAYGILLLIHRWKGHSALLWNSRSLFGRAPKRSLPSRLVLVVSGRALSGMLLGRRTASSGHSAPGRRCCRRRARGTCCCRPGVSRGRGGSLAGSRERRGSQGGRGAGEPGASGGSGCEQVCGGAAVEEAADGLVWAPGPREC